MVAAVLAVVVAQVVFPYLSTNSDEGVYLAQGEALADGHVLSPAPALDPEAYHPWFSALNDGEYTYKYTPVHAALLAASITATGSALPALAVLAAADAVLLALLVRALGASHRAGLLAAGLLAVSPAFFVLSGTYLPYLSNLALLLGFALAAVTGVRRRRPVLFVAAGACVGLAFFGRQYDAVLFAFPVLGYVVAQWWRHDRRRLASALGWLLAGAGPVLVLFLAFNSKATGSPLDLPFTLLDANDSIGFGPRRVLGSDPFVDYTPKIAVQSTLRWLVLVVATVAGGLPLVVTAAVGVARDRRLPGRGLLPALAATWMVGYGLFWGIYAAAFLWNGANFLGPFYDLPVVAMAVAAGAIALDRLGPLSPTFTKALVAVMVVLTVVSTVALLKPNLERTERRRQVAEAISAGLPGGDQPQLVLLPPLRGPFLQHPFPWLRNRPDIGGDRVYAVQDPARDADLIERWKDHAPYLVSVPGGYDDAQQVKPIVQVTAQQVVSGPAVVLRVERSTSPSDVRVGFEGQPPTALPGGSRPAELWVSVGDGRLRVSGPQGEVLAERDPGAASVTLHLTVVGESGSSTESAIPVRVTGTGIDVVVPGVLIRGDPAQPLDVSAAPVDPSAVPGT